MGKDYYNNELWKEFYDIRKKHYSKLAFTKDVSDYENSRIQNLKHEALKNLKK